MKNGKVYGKWGCFYDNVTYQNAKKKKKNYDFEIPPLFGSVQRERVRRKDRTVISPFSVNRTKILLFEQIKVILSHEDLNFLKSWVLFVD